MYSLKNMMDMINFNFIFNFFQDFFLNNTKKTIKFMKIFSKLNKNCTHLRILGIKLVV